MLVAQDDFARAESIWADMRLGRVLRLRWHLVLAVVIRLLLLPVVASAAAWMFLDEPLNGIQMAAMAVVLGALGLIFAGQSEVLNRRRPLRR